MSSLTYRPEIDGLRAVAVFSVVIYHAEFSVNGRNVLPGGFLGVDVFLVISGYLITLILLKELNSTGSIDFLNFYRRRIRRIIPMLLVVVCASIIPAWYFLYPLPLLEFAQSVLASLGFASNVYFHLSGLEYTAIDSSFKPLLHTWSLAVEEQFYIVFPILLFLTFRFAKTSVPILFVAGILGSLVVAVWSAESDPSMGFYYLHTRMWQLLAGSVLAWIEFEHKSRQPKNLVAAAVLSFCGLSLTISAMFLFDHEVPHPSLYTVIPVFGTCLVIRYSGGADVCTRLLASRLAVVLGLISYSLYLWHFPILSFYKIYEDDPKWNVSLLLLVLSVVLSIFSYLIIEKPSRDTASTSFNSLFRTILFVSILLVGWSVYVIVNDGLSERFERYQTLYEKNEFDNQRLAIASWRNLSPEEPYFKKDGGTRVLFIGDSHSKDMFNVFHQNKSLFPSYQFTRMGNKWDNGYLIRRDRFEKLTYYPSYRAADVVILSSKYFLQELPRVVELVRFLKNDGKEVVITSKGTFFETAKKDTLTQFDIMMLNAIDGGVVPPDFNRQLARLMYEKRKPEVYENINKLLKDIAYQEEVLYLEKDLFQCNHVDRTCDGVTEDGYKIYYDGGHYTLEGAKHFGKKIFESNWFETTESK